MEQGEEGQSKVSRIRAVMCMHGKAAEAAAYPGISLPEADLHLRCAKRKGNV